MKLLFRLSDKIEVSGCWRYVRINNQVDEINFNDSPILFYWINVIDNKEGS